MIYLDNGATSIHKPLSVEKAMIRAIRTCANPGRGGYTAADRAAKEVYTCRNIAAKMFDCEPEQVVFTKNCTEGLNIAIRTLVKMGSRVAISGFEHNAVARPLYALKAKIFVCGRKLFDPEDTIAAFEQALKDGVDAAVFTHCSNVFGYILPAYEIGKLCKKYGVPFIVDAAQSAGILPVQLREIGADFIAMPGHKSLLGPQGTGMLLCGRMPDCLLYGGTGSVSASQKMPDFLPDREEAGTLNVPGIAGLSAGMAYVQSYGLDKIYTEEREASRTLGYALHKMGLRTFMGEEQVGTVSCVPHIDCEEAALLLAQKGIAVRAGLHCAPLAHESAGTLSTGTVRFSFGINRPQRDALVVKNILEKLQNLL